jgi:predicted membrane protein
MRAPLSGRLFTLSQQTFCYLFALFLETLGAGVLEAGFLVALFFAAAFFGDAVFAATFFAGAFFAGTFAGVAFEAAFFFERVSVMRALTSALRSATLIVVADLRSLSKP